MAIDSSSQIYDRGVKLAERGRHEEALACIREHIRSCPSDFQAHNDIGVILYCMGKTEEAILAFEEARGLSNESESTELNWNLCEAYLSNAQPGFALQLFDEMERQETLNADLFNRTAHGFLAEGAYGNAIEMLLRSLQMSSEQEILLPMIDVIKSKRPKVALFCAEEGAVEELRDFLKARFCAEVHVGETGAEAVRVMDWCDIAFFAGYIDLMGEVSFGYGKCRKVVMLSEEDVYNRPLEDVSWSDVDTVIAAGGSVVKEALLERVGRIDKSTKVVTIEQGADTERYRYVAKSRGKRIACLDALGAKSNPMFLLQCMQKLHYIDNDFRMYFAGGFSDGAAEEYVRYMAGEMGLSNVVFFDSGVRNEARWLRDKDYIVSAGITGAGLGGVLKGMSCGLKPVVGNFPGARDIFDSEFVFNIAEEFCDQILSDIYEPVRYRGIVEDRYSQVSQLEAINDVLFRLERDISLQPEPAAELKVDDQYGWGSVGFDRIAQQKPEIANVPMQPRELGVEHSPDGVPKVIPIKPLSSEGAGVGSGSFVANNVPTVGAEAANQSINEMSADVLADWRAFTERMNEQPGSAGAMSDVNAMADVKEPDVTPLDLSSGNFPSIGTGAGKAEVNGAPFS